MQSSSKRRRLESSDEKAPQSTIMEVATPHMTPQLWRMTTVSDIADEFNEGAVSFRDLVSGDWKSAIFANCKCQAMHSDAIATGASILRPKDYSM
jgi:hypothetical protein